MIKYLNGTLAEVDTDSIVVEVNGIGDGVNVPVSVIENVREIGSNIKIYTYMNEISVKNYVNRDGSVTDKTE